jgi:hypothetical protein
MSLPALARSHAWAKNLLPSRSAPAARRTPGTTCLTTVAVTSVSISFPGSFPGSFP